MDTPRPAEPDPENPEPIVFSSIYGSVGTYKAHRLIFKVMVVCEDCGATACAPDRALAVTRLHHHKNRNILWP